MSYDPVGKKFHISAHDHEKDSSSSELFDHVVVASGHFSTPNMPYFAGFDSFNGRILHAHDFRDALEFTDQDILILGTSYSAEDIESQCWKYGCRSVTVAHRTAPIGFDWPKNWQEVPALKRVQDKTAYFIDGINREVDSIILCTCHEHFFNFPPDDLRLATANRLAAADLYKVVAWVHNLRLFYFGMQDQWFIFNMFDAQAWWVQNVIMGCLAIPEDKARLMADVAAREARE